MTNVLGIILIVLLVAVLSGCVWMPENDDDADKHDGG